jgi:nitrous oxide reductase accessory protein NosL
MTPLTARERHEAAQKRARRTGNYVYEVRGVGGGLLARANDKASAKHYQRETGGRVVRVASRNPAARVGGKGVTLRNMASVTIKRLPGGAVAVTGRKLNGARRKR